MQTAWDWLHAYAERWHDTWDIVGALGAAAAVVLALGLAWRDGRARRVAEWERDDARAAQLATEERLERERRESQARGIAIWTFEAPWFGLYQGSDVHPDVVSGGSAFTSITVTGKNYTQMPLFDLVGLYANNGIETEIGSASILLPGAQCSFELEPTEPGVVPAMPEQLAIGFRDTAGVKWIRRSDGSLEHVS